MVDILAGKQGVRFLGEPALSMQGVHPTLSYRVPGTDTSYSFTTKRHSKYHDLYQCQQCKIAGKWTGIRVVGNDFALDPCCIDHHPERAQDCQNLVKRAVYEFYRDVKEDPHVCRQEQKKPRRDATRMAVKVHESSEAPASMEMIPDHLRGLTSPFVHRFEPTLHVYNNRSIMQGVQALAASPVPWEHAAYAACAEFLKYLRETWYTGMFSALWDKFGIEELRTTNLTGSYHRQLNMLIKVGPDNLRAGPFPHQAYSQEGS
ncbi:hypothetical protein Aduo_016109 [Ancylostoma duodenale]